MRSLFRFIKFKRASVASLDIHPEEVRLLQISNYQKIAVCPIPLDALVEGKIKNSETIKSAIQHVVQDAQLFNKQVAIALPSQIVISKTILLPRVLSDEECETDIRARLQHYLPGMNEPLYFDFVRLHRHDAHYDEAFLMAARDEQVEAYIKMVQETGLCVVAVNVDAYAFMRATMLLVSTNNEINVVFEFGSAHAQLVVFEKQKIIFSQVILFNRNFERLCEQAGNILQRFCSQNLSAVIQVVATGCDEEVVFGFKIYIKNRFNIDVVTPSQRISTGFGFSVREMNLLPWRSMQKEKKKNRNKKLLFMSMMLMLFIAFSMRYFYAEKKSIKTVQLKQESPPTSTPLRWMGYIENENEMVGLIKMGNQTIVVQKDTIIDEARRVLRLNHDGVTIINNGQEEYLGNVV